MDSLINNLGQYGALGIFSGLLIIALSYIFKQLIAQVEKRLDQTQKDLDNERQSRIHLQERFDNYIAEDRQKVLDILNRATPVLERLERKLNG